ncbi:MAG TPA: tyrosine-type recombinase/integrase [Ktedonobacteraceae bacterium]
MATKRPRRGRGEGSVYQRKDGRWSASLYLENGKRKTVYGRTRKEAYEKLQKTLLEQRQGLLATGPKQTVKQYMEYWLEHVHKQSLRLNSYVKVRELLDLHILPALGHLQVQKMTIQHIQAFYSGLQEKLSASRVRFIHSTLHSALDDAVRTGLVAKNVCDSVTLPRLVKREMQALTPEQARRVVEAAQGGRMEALLLLALTTGMRRGELLGLKWEDITLDEHNGSLQIRRSMTRVAGHGVVTSEPKTASSKRKIALSLYVVGVLKEHRVHQLEMRLKAGSKWTEHDLVFCNVYGNFLHPARLYLLFHKVLADAGVPHIRFHDLRHSAATILLSMGVNVKVVQEILGHSRISMTLDTYSHVLPGMQEEAVEKISGLFQQS